MTATDNDVLCAKCVNTETTIRYNFRLKIGLTTIDAEGRRRTSSLSTQASLPFIIRRARARNTLSILAVAIIGIDYSGRESARGLRVLSSRTTLTAEFLRQICDDVGTHFL